MKSLRLALICLAALSSSGVEARTRGLVFGVSAYPHFAPERQLNAPKNDVARMLRALAARGVAASDLTILADGVAGSQAEPTRAAILAGLDRLGEEAGRGDLVIVYGSGHGSRQAARTARKLDGLEQLFLPRDAAANAGGGAGEPFRNAIRAPEFGERLDRIRAKGADVWFILDSCFSGGASRAAGEDVRDKQIDPAEIGVSFAAALDPDKATPLADQPALPAGSGRLAAFYASQPNETAREVALPPNLPLEKRAWGSVFTLALAQALERSRALSYRQTLVETGRILRADPAFQSRQTPSFEGDGLDAPAPGAHLAAAAAWRVVDGVASAGQLEGLEAGAVVALYDKADADKPMARARVVEAEPLQARLALLKPGCDRPDCPADDKSAALKKAAYARLARPAQGAALGVAGPRLTPGGGDAPFLEGARAALGALAASELQGRIALDADSPALVAWASRDGLRLTPNGGDPARAESGPLVPAGAFAGPDGGRAALARALARARQILNLQKLERAGAGAARGLSVTIEARRFGLDPKTKTCAFAGQGAPVAEGEPVELCDKMVATIENQGNEAVLPAAFFLDDGWNLIARRPSCPVGLTVADRLEPGRRMTLDVPYHARSIRPGLAPATVNGLFVVGAPFRPGEADLPNLCGLTAYNDGAADAARGEALDDLDAMTAGETRGRARLPLEETALSLTFWSVRQPVRP